MNNSDDKENLPAEQPPPREETRVQSENGDEKRSRGAGSPSCERSQTSDAASLLKTSGAPELENFDFGLPKSHKLRKPNEFQTVYKNGKRFDGRFMSAFVLPNDLENHRLGITASRKGVGNAVQRNRAKRLLREAFRLSKSELNQLQTKFDFVTNARRSLLQIKMQAAREDFCKIVRNIIKHETARANTANNETAANVNLTVE